jgi:glyoxylase-like metal-dependent hydrolase (beta-lactamase superfamily II)
MEKSVLRAAAARSRAGTAEAELFTLEKMGDGVWAALAKPTTWTNCNGAVFELSDGLLVVDSHSKPSAAAALVAQIRKEISAKPVRYLVNSHFHWDHTQGNETYRQGGDVRIIASEATRRLLSDGAAERLKQAVGNAEKALESARERRAAASGVEERARLDRAVADTEAYVKELKSLRLELPDITVKGDLTLHDRQQELRIVFRGRGHTEGDISVLSPSRRALATGDLAHGVIPYIGDGYPVEWPKTLGEVAKLEFERFCGGHGRVETGRLRMDQMRGYLEELTAAVAEGKRGGKTVEQLRKEITPAALKSMGGGYLEAVSGGRGAAAVAGGIAANVAQVFAALGRQ